MTDVSPTANVAGQGPSSDLPRSLTFGDLILGMVLSALVGAIVAGFVAWKLDGSVEARAAKASTGIVTVDTEYLLTSHLAQIGGSGASNEEIRQQTTDWTLRFNETVWAIARSQNVIVVDIKGVAAGASDVTDLVEAALR